MRSNPVSNPRATWSKNAAPDPTARRIAADGAGAVRGLRLFHVTSPVAPGHGLAKSGVTHSTSEGIGTAAAPARHPTRPLPSAAAQAPHTTGDPPPGSGLRVGQVGLVDGHG